MNHNSKLILDQLKVKNESKNSTKVKKVDITKSGNLLNLKLSNGKLELGMVLVNVPNRLIRKYVKENNITHENNKLWKQSYSVIGAYKYDEINERIKAQSPTPPSLNLLIVEIITKTTYKVLVNDSEDTLLLMNVVKDIASKEDSNKVNTLCNQLLNTTVINMISGNMSKTYMESKEKSESEKSKTVN